MRAADSAPPTVPHDVGDAPLVDVAHPQRWRALTAGLVAAFMALLDVSIVNVALPSIADELGAGPGTLSWVVSGYALAFGLLLVPAGRLGDARGRRPVFVTGLAVFMLASLACAAAPSPGALVAARLLQGFGGGLITPQTSGLIQQMFSGAERGKAFGALGATIGLSTALGPVVGGVLISAAGPDLGWRLVFLVNVPFGLLALWLAFRSIPHTPRRRGAPREDLDPVGVVLLGLAVLFVLLPFIEAQQWQSAARWLLVPAGAAAGAAWVAWERHYGRTREPVVDLSLFRLRSYSLGSTLALLYFAGFTGVFFIYAQYLQDGLGYSALASGLAVTPFALGSAVTSYLGGRAVTRLGRPLVTAGLVAVVVGLGAAWVVTGLVPGPGVGLANSLPMLVAGLGSGLVISPNVTLTLSEVPVRRAGSAGGALQTGQRIGSAAGIAATGAVFYATAAGSGDFSAAFRNGLLVILAFVVASLALALLDTLARGKPAEPAERLDPAGAADPAETGAAAAAPSGSRR